MNQVCKREECTGCGLCSSICPKGAISLEESKDTGHYFPVINQDICVNCHICVKYCPAFQDSDIKKELKTYAAWRVNPQDQIGSSSGGVAAAFYETAIANGYYVVGARFNDNLKLEMKCTSRLEECEAFKGSKYIQAYSNNVYKDAILAIKSGKKLLFIGTPCQCAAMRSAARDYNDSLLTVELICHGTPSQKVFFEYIHSIAQRKHKIISGVSFRSSWGVELCLTDHNKEFWKYKVNEDDFLSAFQNGVLHNYACYNCKYAQKDRCSDITIGDFWKIGETVPFRKPGCKVSVVVVNSDKGLDFLNICSNLHLEERKYEEALNGNPNLYRPSRKASSYDLFWNEYHSKGIKAAMKKIGGGNLSRKRIKNKVLEKLKYVIKRILGRSGLSQVVRK